MGQLGKGNRVPLPACLGMKHFRTIAFKSFFFDLQLRKSKRRILALMDIMLDFAFVKILTPCD